MQNLFRFEQTNLLNDLHHKHTETANSLQTSLESVVTGLSEQRLILVALQQQAESLRSELSQSNSTIDAMQTRIDQHAAKLTAFESSIGSLQAAVPELQQSQSAQHQAVVDSIERQVNVLSETCKVLFCFFNFS
jgi:chromosome segregation ATPase